MENKTLVTIDTSKELINALNKNKKYIPFMYHKLIDGIVDIFKGTFEYEQKDVVNENIIYYEGSGQSAINFITNTLLEMVSLDINNEEYELEYSVRQYIDIINNHRSISDVAIKYSYNPENKIIHGLKITIEKYPICIIYKYGKNW